MNLRTFGQASALLTAGLLLTSCGIFSSEAPRLATVDDLVSSVERVHTESELGQDAARQSVEILRALVTHDYGPHGDAVRTYEAFLSSIEMAERRANIFAESVERMESAAGPVFEQWEADLHAFTSPSMRERSQARYEEAKARFDSVSTASEPTLMAFRQLLVGLRDHALFLGHDFNEVSIAAIADDFQQLTVAAEDVDDNFNETQRAAQAYFAMRAMPGSGNSTEARGRSGVARPPSGGY